MSTVGQEDACPFCSIMLAVPAAIACGDAGDLDDARHHLAIAERSAALWKGSAWHASNSRSPRAYRILGRNRSVYWPIKQALELATGAKRN
jgi:hypothetical protein